MGQAACCCASEDIDGKGSATINQLQNVGRRAPNRNTSEVFRTRQSINLKKSIDEVEQIIFKQKLYSDPYFKPELSSIYDDYDLDVPMRDSYSSVVWKRAREIFGEDCRVFGDEKPKPSDINHDHKSNGQFLIFLSAMSSRFEDFIPDLFETKEMNIAGIYIIYFFVNGVRTPVVIDDLLPVWSTTMQPVFATAKDQTLWLPFLQKAWAKLNSTYWRTELHNSTFLVMSHLKGVPTYALLHHSSQEEQNLLYFRMKEALERNYLVIVSGRNESNESVDSKLEKEAGKAFEVLRLIEFQHNYEDLRLVKMRNPFKFPEITNEWNTESENWTEELRDQLGGATDGSVIFIPFEDYAQEFSRTCISAQHFNEPKVHSTVPYSFEIDPNLETSQPAFFRLTLERDVDTKKDTFAISVQQQMDRL